MDLKVLAGVVLSTVVLVACSVAPSSQPTLVTQAGSSPPDTPAPSSTSTPQTVAVGLFAGGQTVTDPDKRGEIQLPPGWKFQTDPDDPKALRATSPDDAWDLGLLCHLITGSAGWDEMKRAVENRSEEDKAGSIVVENTDNTLRIEGVEGSVFLTARRGAGFACEAFAITFSDKPTASDKATVKQIVNSVRVR